MINNIVAKWLLLQQINNNYHYVEEPSGSKFSGDPN